MLLNVHLWLSQILVIVAFLASCSVPALNPKQEFSVPSKISTAQFDGNYDLVPEESPSIAKIQTKLDATTHPKKRENLETLLNLMIEENKVLRIQSGIIRLGTTLQQEFSLQNGKITASVFQGKAVWHEDIGDPGDSSVVTVRLHLQNERLEFSFYDETNEPFEPLVFRKSS